MKMLKINNLYSSLIYAKPDPAVGISLAHLGGDELFSMYVTSIPPQKKLNAHYHFQGDEVYQVIEGKGNMLLKNADPKDTSSKELTIEVITGDVFIIPPLTSHQLINPGSDPLIMLFSCPQAHITTDRHMVSDLKVAMKEDASCH